MDVVVVLFLFFEREISMSLLNIECTVHVRRFISWGLSERWSGGGACANVVARTHAHTHADSTM